MIDFPHHPGSTFQKVASSIACDDIAFVAVVMVADAADSMSCSQVTNRKKRFAWRSPVQLYDVEVERSTLQGVKNLREVWRQPGVVLEDGSNLRTVLHHVPHDLTLAYPIGNRPIGLGPKTLESTSFPVDGGILLWGEFPSVNGAVERYFQTQLFESLFHLASAFVCPVEIDYEQFHGWITSWQCRAFAFTSAFVRGHMKPLSDGSLTVEYASAAVTVAAVSIRSGKTVDVVLCATALNEAYRITSRRKHEPAILVDGGSCDGGSGTICSARFPLAHALQFAACAYVGESFEAPARYYANNVIGALHLPDAARSAGNVP
ncbi:MAG: hypothetical protein OXI15_11675 [Chromatiales bacterium]|nr:hypothetical protein [Chromatiales bacterium]